MKLIFYILFYQASKQVHNHQKKIFQEEDITCNRFQDSVNCEKPKQKEGKLEPYSLFMRNQKKIQIFLKNLKKINAKVVILNMSDKEKSDIYLKPIFGLVTSLKPLKFKIKFYWLESSKCKYEKDCLKIEEAEFAENQKSKDIDEFHDLSGYTGSFTQIKSDGRLPFFRDYLTLNIAFSLFNTDSVNSSFYFIVEFFNNCEKDFDLKNRKNNEENESSLGKSEESFEVEKTNILLDSNNFRKYDPHFNFYPNSTFRKRSNHGSPLYSE